MAYSKEVLHRAEARLEQARRQNELDCERRISAIYEKLPRLAEIDRELRKTSAKVYAAAFRESESPEQAMQKLKEENLSLQRERDWILESENIDPEDLEREPVCRLCGGSGWRGAAMCECLQELCRQEQKKVLLQSFGTGKESFEKFRLDVDYVRYITFAGDVKIILDTVRKVLHHEGISAENSATMEEFRGTPEEVGK